MKTLANQPPSSDPNRKKSSKVKKSSRKPGGQQGRIGTQLKPVSEPDKIEVLTLDKRTLPKGNYTESGFEARQVVDFEVSIFVTEYRAQVLMDTQGRRFVAPFPDHIKRPIQYGPKTKSTAVYMSQYQLIPYARIVDYFSQQVGINLSPGSLFNFNQEAYEALTTFDAIAKSKLIQSSHLHADETGININGKRVWLHTACNNLWTYFYPHAKRGSDAMNDIGILPNFRGVLCHDHWKAYYQYSCQHALCNAHHLRELKWSATEDHQKWAYKMIDYLNQLNKKVDESNGTLTQQEQIKNRRIYKKILKEAEIECPIPELPDKPKKRGRPKKSKSRNLLERLIHYENDVLRFSENVEIPFTNNQGENDLRMTKVQQKISGCFRSDEGAKIFCRIRAYLITCRKHAVSPTEALESLFKGELPSFCQT